MKTSSKIAIVAAAVGLWLIAKKKQSISGIGSTRISQSVLNMAKRLFDNYDRLVEIEREHDRKCDAIYESFEARGIDPFADENERMVIDALYQAGLTDENGMTDVMMNRHNAKKELLNFINANIITLFPIPAADRKLLSDTKSVVYQNRILEVTRDYVNKMLEHNRNIREILNSGVGEVLESDYHGAMITTTDGKAAVKFGVIGDEIGVHAYLPSSESDRDYMDNWEFWSTIGWYSTLSGAKRGAKRWMEKMGHELSDKDLNSI